MIRFIILLNALFSLESSAIGQSILQSYYHGDTIKMMEDAKLLISTSDPVFHENLNQHMDRYEIENQNFSKKIKYKAKIFKVKDGIHISSYHLKSKSFETIIFVHGVKSNSFNYLKSSYLLHKSTKAEVYAIDLRGHGNSEGRPGDVDYINQYADDLADIIAAIKKDKPKNKIILAGHSAGCGVILRYAMNNNNIKADKYIMFAPHIGHNSPALVQESTTSKTDSVHFAMQLNIQRIIGLAMFNEMNIHIHDSLPVLFFNVPHNAPIQQYSHRANMSLAPENYKEGLKSIKAPLLVLIGSKDEAFEAEKIKNAVSENSSGITKIIDGVTHNGIMHHSEVFSIIKKWSQKQ